MIRWPGKIKAGSVSNEIVQHHDWLPTFLAAAGDPDISREAEEGLKAGADGDTEYKVHIDGFNLLPYLTGEVEHEPAARASSTSPTTATCSACAFENWKIVFLEQRCQGTLQIWAEPFTTAARAEAVQPAHRPVRVRRHHVEHLLRLVDRPDYLRLLRHPRCATQFLDTFKEFPPRQRAGQLHASTSAVEKLEEVPGHPRRLDAGLLERRAHEVGDRRLRRARHHRRRPDFVAPEERVAVFDNDGTLWCEKPAYIQLDFLVRRLGRAGRGRPVAAPSSSRTRRRCTAT